MIDISELMGDPDFSSQITVTRTSTGTKTRLGVYVPGVPTTTTETHIVQPDSSPDTAQFLPEGDRASTRVQVWSHAALALRMPDGMGQQADTFTWNGMPYRVAFSKPWDGHGYHYAIGVSYVP